ncbi:butyrophilin subfamily 2 member A2-like [Salmo salar]|uniref:Butyrophilin subfamily 2 member A2-like n=1 Tax=Salmo salar TaxID=8030 RepID=A0ABM3DCQ4_SALSA|nr:butyrophilin subfamily 2 member A2-like [Salmo salar]
MKTDMFLNKRETVPSQLFSGINENVGYIPLLDHQKTIIQLIVGESTHLLTTQTPLGDRSHEIKGAASRPVIIIEGNEGDEVVLRCEAEGCYPEPVMEWCDAHGRVLSAAGPTETSRDREGCYTVTSHVIVQNSDNNTFTCRVQQLEIKHMKERRVHVPGEGLFWIFEKRHYL